MNNVVSLDNLFHNRVFRVPDYQRGYSWEDRQVREFLEDLDLLEPDRLHYTGTIVLHEPPSQPQRMDEDGNRCASVAIVDGQQRLTTIVLLLDGIRRLLAASSEQDRVLSHGIKKNYISTRATTGEPLFKIALNTDTDHFFRVNILADEPAVEEAKISSQQRLANAKRQIADYLANNAQEHRTDWLRVLYDKIVAQLRFTLYLVEHEAEVGVIFEVMNDRGKPLTELEKVKNYLLHSSVAIAVSHEPNELADSVNSAWSEILLQLMASGLESSADEDRLLRANWLTRYNPQSRQWQGSRSIKDRFSLRRHQGRHPKFRRRLGTYTQRLREDCIMFCDAYRPTRTGAFGSFNRDADLRLQVVEWSAKLARIGVVVTFLPLLLATRKRWPSDTKKYLELLKLCEAFAFRVYRLMEFRADAGQAALFGIGHRVAKKKIDFSEMTRAIKRELNHRCGDTDFNNVTRADDPDDWYSWSGLRYFLYEYEIHLASENGSSPNVAWEELRSRDLRDTVEHILPQTIERQRYWTERFEPEEHERYVHDLGNLTLTKHNAHYLNKSFLRKKGRPNAEGRCYAKSSLYLERTLTRWRHWDASAIDERRSTLLEWARERWAVDLVGVQPERRVAASDDNLSEDDLEGTGVDDDEA